MYSIDYSKLKTSRPDTLFFYHIMTQESFYKLKVEYMDDRPGERGPEWDCCLMTVTDVLTTCAVVIFRVKVSCITSFVGIKHGILT